MIITILIMLLTHIMVIILTITTKVLPAKVWPRRLSKIESPGLQ